MTSVCSVRQNTDFQGSKGGFRESIGFEEGVWCSDQARVRYDVRARAAAFDSVSAICHSFCLPLSWAI